MPTVTVAGNLGKDAQYKQTNSSELCSFSVADEAGYGDNKQTLWFDVTNWGRGSQGLANMLGKGSKVTVVGELSTREHDGKTYLQVRADLVKIQHVVEPAGGGQKAQPATGGGASNYDDLDDEIGF